MLWRSDEQSEIKTRKTNWDHVSVLTECTKDKTSKQKVNDVLFPLTDYGVREISVSGDVYCDLRFVCIYTYEEYLIFSAM